MGRFKEIITLLEDVQNDLVHWDHRIRYYKDDEYLERENVIKEVNGLRIMVEDAILMLEGDI